MIPERVSSLWKVYPYKTTLPLKVGTIHAPIADMQHEIQNRCRTYNQRIKKDVDGTALHNCEPK
jgi:hypothetical protein